MANSTGAAENVVSVPKEAVARLLDAWHRSLQDDQRKRDQAVAVIDSCKALGLITADECRLRLLALSSCPGHNDSRSWCAYCGNLKGAADAEQ